MKKKSNADDRARKRELELREREIAIRTAVALAAASPVLTIPDAASFMRVPVAHVRELIRDGALGYQPQGKRWLVSRRDLEALLAAGWQRKTKGKGAECRNPIGEIQGKWEQGTSKR